MTDVKPVVLVADDDAELVEALARRCELLGLGVEKAFDGLTALAKLDDLQPQFAILDVNMPGGNGLAVLEMMSANQHLQSIPTVIMTGREDIETMRRCFDFSGYFIPKCSDIWPRIEPLLREHLTLSEERQREGGESLRTDYID